MQYHIFQLEYCGIWFLFKFLGNK